MWEDGGPESRPSRGCSTRDLGHLQGAKGGTFKDVEADRLKFRGFPDFNACPFLDETSRSIYLHPFRHSVPPAEFEGRVARVRVHCCREERLKLYRLLDETGRIRFFSKDEVRVGSGSGVFAVLKSLEADRLTLDSRPHNLREAPPGRFIRTLVCLSFTLNRRSSTTLTRMTSGISTASLESPMNNVDGTVWLLQWPRERFLPSNFFRRWMFSHSELNVGLSCLAMGDTQGVELAHSCHLGICLQHGIIQGENLTAMNLPPPRGKTAAGIVIDDFVSLSIEARSPAEVAGEPTESCRLADEAFSTYKIKVKLIPHEEKSIRDQLQADFWGISLDGSLGLARGSLKRAVPPMKVILSIVQVGRCSVGLLEVLAGGLIALFIYRRRLI